MRAEDDEEPIVFIIIGRAFLDKDEDPIDVHIVLSAPDDDTAVRETLNAMASEGYVEAELDQIGVMEGMPDDEPYASAYQGAIEGEVSIVTF